MFAYSMVGSSQQHSHVYGGRTDSPRVAGGGRKHVLASLMGTHAPPAMGRGGVERGKHIARPRQQQQYDDNTMLRDAIPTPPSSTETTTTPQGTSGCNTHPSALPPPSIASLQLVRPASRGGSIVPRSGEGSNQTNGSSSGRAWSGQPSPRFVFAGDTGLSSFTLVGAQRAGPTNSSITQHHNLVLPTPSAPCGGTAVGTSTLSRPSLASSPSTTTTITVALPEKDATRSITTKRSADGSTRRKRGGNNTSNHVAPCGGGEGSFSESQQHQGLPVQEGTSTPLGSGNTNMMLPSNKTHGTGSRPTTPIAVATALIPEQSSGDALGSPARLPPRPVGRQKEPVHNVDLFSHVGGPTSPAQPLDSVVAVKEKRRKSSSSTLTMHGSSSSMNLSRLLQGENNSNSYATAPSLHGSSVDQHQHQTHAALTPCNSGCSVHSSSDDDDLRMPQSPAKRLDGGGIMKEDDPQPQLWAVRQTQAAHHSAKSRSADEDREDPLALLMAQSARTSTKQHLTGGASTNPRSQRGGGNGMEEDAFPLPRDGREAVGGLSSARRRAPQQVASSVDEFADPFPMRKTKKKIPIIVEDEWEWDSAWGIPNAASTAAKVDVHAFTGGDGPPQHTHTNAPSVAQQPHHPPSGGPPAVRPTTTHNRPGTSTTTSTIGASNGSSSIQAPFRRSGPLRQQPEEWSPGLPTCTSKPQIEASCSTSGSRRATTTLVRSLVNVEDTFADDDDVVKSPSPSAAFIAPPLPPPPAVQGAHPSGGAVSRGGVGSGNHFQRRLTM